MAGSIFRIWRLGQIEIELLATIITCEMLCVLHTSKITTINRSMKIKS